MIAPRVLARRATGPRLGRHRKPVCDNRAGDAPFTGTAGLPTADISWVDACLGQITVHTLLRGDYCSLNPLRLVFPSAMAERSRNVQMYGP
jgi:hypothetical protein